MVLVKDPFLISCAQPVTMSTPQCEESSKDQFFHLTAAAASTAASWDALAAFCAALAAAFSAIKSEADGCADLGESSATPPVTLMFE
jgi:hypothetical protein